METNKYTGDEITDFHRACTTCGQSIIDCQCERCANCGELADQCECTEEDMNRWAHDVLYGHEDESIERFRNDQMSRCPYCGEPMSFHGDYEEIELDCGEHVVFNAIDVCDNPECGGDETDKD